jgi:hypothetical protein
MTEAEIANFQANLLMALYELETAPEIRSQFPDPLGYLETAEDSAIELAAELVKTWGKLESSNG